MEDQSKSDDKKDIMKLKVKNQQDFIRFVKELRNNFIDENETWDNTNIVDFLGGMEGYCTDKDFEKLSWKSFAEILLASTVYE